MNTEYVLWFGALVVVAGAALLWLAIGDVPDLADDDEAEPDPAVGGAPEPASEPAGEDGLASPA